MKVFISHSSQDAELAKTLTELMRKALRLSSEDIRCSSVDGYRLQAGAPTDELLRKEVDEAELLVGLITPNSLRSLYVAFELGARWGKNKPMIPLLALGVTPTHLGGPLAGITALNCDNESQVTQFLEQAASDLSVELERPSSILSDVSLMAQMSADAAPHVEEEVVTSNPHESLTPKERDLLLTATEDEENGAIRHLRTINGDEISSGHRVMNERGNNRSEAEWAQAIRNLEKRELILDQTGKGEYYTVSGNGYEVADTLRTIEE